MSVSVVVQSPTSRTLRPPMFIVSFLTHRRWLCQPYQQFRVCTSHHQSRLLHNRIRHRHRRSGGQDAHFLPLDVNLVRLYHCAVRRRRGAHVRCFDRNLCPQIRELAHAPHQHRPDFQEDRQGWGCRTRPSSQGRHWSADRRRIRPRAFCLTGSSI